MIEIYIWVVITLVLLVIGLLSAWLHTITKLNYMTRYAKNQESRAIMYCERWEQSSKKKGELEDLLLQVNELITEELFT